MFSKSLILHKINVPSIYKYFLPIGPLLVEMILNNDKLRKKKKPIKPKEKVKLASEEINKRRDGTTQKNQSMTLPQPSEPKGYLSFCRLI